jgi:hypothetical protein
MKNDSMIAALKSEFVFALRERGFKGSFPHFRRVKPDKIDLLTVGEEDGDFRGSAVEASAHGDHYTLW